MTITTTNSFTGPLTANGATTVFPFTFTALDTSHVEVMLRDDTTLAETIVSTSAYTVTLTGGGGGNVTFDTAPASGQTVWLRLNPDFVQEISFSNGSTLLASFFNSVGDQATSRIQALKGLLDRALKVPLGETGYSMRPNSELEGKALKVSGTEIVANEADGAAEGALEIQTERTTTSGTLAAADQYTGIPWNNASAISVTIPPVADVPFDTGAFVEFYQKGAGAITLVAGAGVTLQSRDNKLTTGGQYAVCAVRHLGSNVWSIVGDLV